MDTAPTTEHWVGPFRLRDMLENCMEDTQQWPPEAAGIYVVSLRPWQGQPAATDGILYVGGNPHNPAQLFNRIGNLVRDMLGFFGGTQTGTHAGGQSIYRYCYENRIKPLDLYLGWLIGIQCSRCSESTHWGLLSPTLNKNQPAHCTEHAKPADAG